MHNDGSKQLGHGIGTTIKQILSLIINVASQVWVFSFKFKDFASNVSLNGKVHVKCTKEITLSDIKISLKIFNFVTR